MALKGLRDCHTSMHFVHPQSYVLWSDGSLAPPWFVYALYISIISGMEEDLDWSEDGGMYVLWGCSP